MIGKRVGRGARWKERVAGEESGVRGRREGRMRGRGWDEECDDRREWRRKRKGGWG